MDNRIRLLFGLIVVGCLLAGSTSAGAQVAAQGSLYQTPYVVVAGEDNRKWSPAVAYDSIHNEYLVVWENVWPNGYHDIYGRRITAAGQLLGEFVVYSDNTHHHYSKQPSVAYDSTHDRYLVVWSYDAAGDDSDYDILGRFIPWNGPDPLQSEFGIDIEPRTSTTKPRVAYGVGSDEFMLVWKVEGSPSYIAGEILPYNILNATGIAVSSGPEVRDFPDITYNKAGNEFVATWDEDVIRTVQDLDIYAIRLRANGTPQAPEFGVATSTLNEQHPTVAACFQADQYLFAWQSPGSPPDENIYGRMMSGSGVLSPTYGLAGTTLPQQYARLSCNPAGNEYFLVWQDQYGAGFYPYFGIWAELIETDFTIKPSFGVVGPGWIWLPPPPQDNGFGTDRKYPAVAYGTTGAVVVWQHQRDDASGWLDIWARAVWPNASQIFVPTVLR